jgi:hypothetical protein
VCNVLERSLVQFESVSVAGGDLVPFFRGASANAATVSGELRELDAAPGTETFMSRAAGAFEALVPLLDGTADALEAAGGTGTPGPDALASMQTVLAAREPEINAVLSQVRESAKSDLPVEAARALSETRPCGSVHRR